MRAAVAPDMARITLIARLPWLAHLRVSAIGAPEVTVAERFDLLTVAERALQPGNAALMSEPRIVELIRGECACVRSALVVVLCCSSWVWGHCCMRARASRARREVDGLGGAMVALFLRMRGNCVCVHRRWCSCVVRVGARASASAS